MESLARRAQGHLRARDDRRGAKPSFARIADREPPTEPCKEVWIIAGRRAGKDSIASLLAAHAAAMFNDAGNNLRPGERGVVMCLACDRDQARIVLNYTRSYFTEIALLQAMVSRETHTASSCRNGIDIAVATNSYRSVRGRPVLCAVLDETAFWRDENSATPDIETYNALKPGLVGLPGSLVIGISSPYRRSGLLHKKFNDHYGKDGKVLVIKAPTRLLNPTIDQSVIDEAIEEDPAAASAGVDGRVPRRHRRVRLAETRSTPASRPRSGSGPASTASPTPPSSIPRAAPPIP